MYIDPAVSEKYHSKKRKKNMLIEFWQIGNEGVSFRQALLKLNSNYREPTIS